MNEVMLSVIIVLALIVGFGFLNEKVVKLPSEIAFLIFSAVLGLILMLCFEDLIVQQGDVVPEYVLDQFLMDGVLCFMLFAGSSSMKFSEIRRQSRLIFVLAILTTLLTAVFYGVLFYGVVSLLALPLDFFQCLLLGCIVSPTDPIAAMSILRKIGLPEDVALVIEGESLFNDGVSVALFVTVSGLITGNAEGGFFSILGRELFGAVLIGFIISLLLYQFFKRTEDEYRRIFASLLAVALSYVLSDYFGCSGAIAAVVCGIFFATQTAEIEAHFPKSLELYRGFWNVVDNLLNSVIYVMLGLCIVNIHTVDHMLALGIAAVAINLVARYIGVLIGAKLSGPLPEGYSLPSFTNLMTWSGLKGALCVALAMESVSLLPEAAFEVALAATFCIVFFTTIVQGLTVGKAYISISKKDESAVKTAKKNDVKG